MDIYLVPAGRHHYGLYCEVDDRRQLSEDDTRPGWRAALSRQFHRMLAYLEAERRGRLAKATEAERRSYLQRLRDRVLGWLAERVAEQRLLWFLRSERSVTAHHPDDMLVDDAERWVRSELRRDSRRHLFWMFVDAGIYLASRAADAHPRPECPVAVFLVPGHRAFPLVGRRAQRSPARRLDVCGVGPAGRTAASARHDAGRPGSARARGRLAPDSAPSRPLHRADGPRGPVIYSRRLTLRELAERLGCRLEGDGSVEIGRVATLEAAGPGDVSFLSNPKYTSQLSTTRASAVIVGADAAPAPCPMLRARDPYLAFAAAAALLAPDDRPAPGVSPSAHVDPGATIGPSCHIGAFASVGDGAAIGARTIVHPHAVIYPGVVIGDDCVIHAHASIRERCRIGNRVIIQNGAVIGSDGYGFAPRPDGTFQKIPQAAPVVIEDDVEIGANTAIDRPAVGETRIQAGTKIDNLVHVAHGVRVGRNVMLAGQVGIAGSTTIGDSSVFGGQVGIAGHLHIGKGTKATAQTGIPNSLPDGSFVSGYPAIDNREWLKSSAVFRRLPEMKKALAALEKRLAGLEATLGAGPDSSHE